MDLDAYSLNPMFGHSGFTGTRKMHMSLARYLDNERYIRHFGIHLRLIL